MFSMVFHLYCLRSFFFLCVYTKWVFDIKRCLHLQKLNEIQTQTMQFLWSQWVMVKIRDAAFASTFMPTNTLRKNQFLSRYVPNESAQQLVFLSSISDCFASFSFFLCVLCVLTVGFSEWTKFNRMVVRCAHTHATITQCEFVKSFLRCTCENIH